MSTVVDAILNVAPVDRLKRRMVRTSARQRLQEQYGLSDRQADIVELVGEGMSNKKIAAKLGITVQTVKTALTVIYERTEAADREDLVQLYQKTLGR